MGSSTSVSGHDESAQLSEHILIIGYVKKKLQSHPSHLLLLMRALNLQSSRANFRPHHRGEIFLMAQSMSPFNDSYSMFHIMVYGINCSLRLLLVFLLKHFRFPLIILLMTDYFLNHYFS